MKADRGIMDRLAAADRDFPLGYSMYGDMYGWYLVTIDDNGRAQLYRWSTSDQWVAVERVLSYSGPRRP